MTSLFGPSVELEDGEKMKYLGPLVIYDGQGGGVCIKELR